MLDRFKGCLLGLACGDALGRPTEFRGLHAILAAFGPNGIEELPEPALFTDDTQMTVAVANALCRAGGESLDALANAMAEEFVRWLESPENVRGPGRTCLSGCGRLKAGVSWRESGLRESKGCGANMRVAPVGLYCRDDPAGLRLTARMSSLLTHAHPTALAAAEATALCVAWAAQGTDPAAYVERLEAHAEGVQWDDELGKPWGDESNSQECLLFGWQELRQAVRGIPQALRDRPRDYCSVLGEAWVAEEALACALYCVCAHPRDYAAVVRTGANSNGDSDSIACIAGAISGAYLGQAAIPQDWRDRIEKADELNALAEGLFAAAL